jgi:hypothetical protein
MNTKYMKSSKDKNRRVTGKEKTDKSGIKIR